MLLHNVFINSQRIGITTNGTQRACAIMWAFNAVFCGAWAAVTVVSYIVVIGVNFVNLGKHELWPALGLSILLLLQLTMTKAILIKRANYAALHTVARFVPTHALVWVPPVFGVITYSVLLHNQTHDETWVSGRHRVEYYAAQALVSGLYIGNGGVLLSQQT